MTEDTSTQPTFPDPEPGDPRYSVAVIVGTVGQMMEATTPEQMGNRTPCSEFSVKELMEHLILVLRRMAAIGNGDHWSSVEQTAQDADWSASFWAAAGATKAAWTDPAKMEAVYEVPWGELPGAPMLMTYAAELATHGWDLAAATGQDFAVDDALLEGPWMAAQFLPEEGRGGEEIPFDPVVRPAEDAPILLKIAGWMGRNVNEPFAVGPQTS